ncbi:MULTISPECIES: O-linked N-acetylglucosamine transferase, SPINDLY family protein [Nitrospirillum]|uniref:protein O-GlcNAc transferase n=1 Tax=Nitrospirillum amazonense TaxID=28077 RepID=A0A560G6Y1_9PROT|nr:glycosyl transferase family 1 [Nitrospirillum amazonense]MEC4593130.1 glycosyl transferase family 1 [Nitrospirillum amazonense]TWB29581.1 putative O-linked N-acetylglucosamine transferase (SPINDLY family) [Nitrospirillum amazonense]
MASAASITHQAPLQTADVIEYLTARAWKIPPGIEETAFRYLVGRLDFTALLGLVEAAREAAPWMRPASLYQLWLDEVPADATLRHAAYFNLGVELANVGDTVAAGAAYNAALSLKSDFLIAAINLGLMSEGQGKHDEALEIWRRSIQPDDMRTTLLNQRGRLLERLSRFEEAERELYRSLLTVPKQSDAISHWVHLRLKMCAWPVYLPIPGLTKDDMVASSGGLTLMSLFDENAVVNRWVEQWISRFGTPERLAPAQGYAHEKVRIGYLSSDYNLHPVSMLMVELIEKHDRTKFEVYGYDMGLDDNSYLRHRILGAFDQWFRVVEMSDDQVAALMRQHELDILVDLNGLTDGSRPGIVRRKPAPVQITYLGFVGSQPIPELDYAIVDDFVVPKDLAGDFHPKPLYMPICYQVNDSKALVDPSPTRESVGLPADKFVYTCFSNTYKITEEVFDAWMRILGGVDNSVLWLLARTPWARQNMQERARARGIDPGRLLFAGPASPAQYLARLPLADVFLDTYPYNSGTTASDALRMGLPIVTLSGKTFASRMAGSLLRTVGLPQGVTTSVDDYVKLAVKLGNKPKEYKAFRDALAGGEAWRRTLGDTDRFVQELEERLLSIRVTPGKAG